MQLSSLEFFVGAVEIGWDIVLSRIPFGMPWSDFYFIKFGAVKVCFLGGGELKGFYENLIERFIEIFGLFGLY